MRWIPGLLLISMLGACCTAATEPETAKASEEKVIEAIRGMYQAYQQADLPRVGKYLTEDSTCYDAATSVLVRGRKAVLDHFGTILARHEPGEAWESSIEGMKVTTSNDLAVATYQLRTSAGGIHALSAVTQVFQRRGDAWLCIRLHRSWTLPPK